MRILFASMPADGHFNPLTGIAVNLADRGHDVRWYAGPAYGAKLDRLGMRWFPYQRATEIMAGNLNDLFPERAGLKGPRLISFELDTFFVSQVENHFQDLVHIRKDWSFDALVCDGAMYAEQLVAESLSVPVFAVGLTMVMPDAQGPPPFFGLRPARTPVGRLHHAIVRRMLAGAMKAGTTHYNEILAEHGIAPIRPDGFPHEPMLRTRRVFLNGSPGLEFPGYEPLANAEYVGPLVPARAAKSPGAALPDVVVDVSTRVVAVSQGTVDNTDPGKLMIPTIEALKDTGYVVVATTAGAQTEALRARFPFRNVVIEDYIDYDDLFPHVDVFVTSGGLRQQPRRLPARRARRRRRQARGQERRQRPSRLQPARHRPAQRTPQTGRDPYRGPDRPRRPDLRRERRKAARGTPRIRPDRHDRERHHGGVGRRGCSRPQAGAYTQGSLRSRNVGSPMASALTCSITACVSAGGSLRSPSRAASSEEK